jgi:hypothetical protein
MKEKQVNVFIIRSLNEQSIKLLVNKKCHLLELSSPLANRG